MSYVVTPFCSSRKHAFRRASDARKALKKSQSHATCRSRSTYQCPECGWFHLTSKTRSERW